MTELLDLSNKSSDNLHHEYLSTCIQILESKILDGCYIEFEGVFWVLYNDDGEGVTSGTTLIQMITNLGQSD